MERVSNKSRGVIVMTGDEVIREIDNLDEDQREKVFKHTFQNYFKDVWIVGSNYDWWDNEEDQIYDEKYREPSQ